MFGDQIGKVSYDEKLVIATWATCKWDNSVDKI